MNPEEPTAMTPPGPTIADVVFPEQLNHRGTLFGGAAMALMDRAAFVAASREARADVVCAGADEIVFSQPIRPGDLVEATAAVERRGRRSMAVSVVVVAETLPTGERREAVRGLFHMVVAAEAPQAD
ncbi:acyl-CoA thioesterase [Glycomyces sp. NPDC048151]|uniref:acyl-CoA thioesterase n=1 Tax=Glycomyces sp. NPDC048151 TaxID=3364002 RepID=UPI0037107787